MFYLLLSVFLHGILSQITQLTVDFNDVVLAKQLYTFPKIDKQASDGESGAGVYYCSQPNWQGTCVWRNVIQDNSFQNSVGKCFPLMSALGSVGPDQGVYCAIFHGEDTCRWFSGQPPQQTVPAATELTVALTYPGLKDLPGEGFGSDSRGVWAYCFRGDSTSNPCILVWGAAC